MSKDWTSGQSICLVALYQNRGMKLQQSSAALRYLALICLSVTIFCKPAHTQGTYTAATCSRSDVNAVINGPTHTAVNGDTIVIPSGTCTWTSGITITGIGIDITGTGAPNNGGGTVGAGTTNTTLVDNASAPLFTFSGLTTSSSTAKVELLTMSASGAGANTIRGAIAFIGSCASNAPYCPSYRVDNINFSANTWETPMSGGFVLLQDMFGVSDHNSATESTAASPTLTQINFASWQGIGDYGDNSFASPDTFGTAQAVYIENNSVSGVRLSENDVSPGGGNSGGARYVCRFNTVSNMSGTGVCSAHGTAWGGRFRGQRQVEVYYNTVSVGGCNAVDGLNSGTAYYFSNSVSAPGGGCNEFVNLDIARFVQTGAPWNHCDGTQPWDQSPWSSSSACIDQPGSGAGRLLQNSTPVLALAQGVICSLLGECWPEPALDPIYEAGEVMTAGGLGSPVVVASDGSSTRVLANRDYYAEVSQSAQTSATSPFNGTTGTGYGTLARRPATCTAGVGYWATDQGTWNSYSSTQEGELFTCTSTNTWTMHYEPYAYPHPLTTGGTTEGSGNPPEPPADLIATVE